MMEHRMELFFDEYFWRDIWYEEPYKTEQTDNADEGYKDRDGNPHHLGGFMGVMAMMLHLFDMMTLVTEEGYVDVPYTIK